MKQALGMIETKGMVALFEATDAMLKAANVTFAGWVDGRQRTGDRFCRRGCRGGESRHRRGCRGGGAASASCRACR